MLYYIYILKATSIICCDIKLKIVNSFLGLNLVKIFQQFLFQNFFLKITFESKLHTTNYTTAVKLEFLFLIFFKK